MIYGFHGFDLDTALFERRSDDWPVPISLRCSTRCAMPVCHNPAVLSTGGGRGVLSFVPRVAARSAFGGLTALLATLTLATSVAMPARAAAGAPGTTCRTKRAFYEGRNPGLKQTLGSGTVYSAPCVLDAYLAIERAAVEFGVADHTDTLIRIAACESLLQPGIVGRRDPSDVGLFQWNEKPPRYWWSTARAAFNLWQRRKASASHGTYAPWYASDNRYDPYNSARVAAWMIKAFPRSWPLTWLCKGVYDPSAGRIR